ncbi:hypothetical protein IDH44_21355 [Paenibacillus sp. IB182496]|uniref:Alpha/beta hydrolase n=1 Tax=Paenibacillus sabuli TaxID=2772509 RepID=A0A927BYP4_9BACL|nr:hypothetical protein [Paenibacillus sabuli]MBD2847748.1 hypothetical protein [Paenibacillus sabuli]
MKRLRTRLRRLPEFGSRTCLSAIAGIAALQLWLLVETARGMPTGLGAAADALLLLAVIAAGYALFFAGALLLCVLLVWIPLRVPWLLLGLVGGTLGLFPKLFTYMNTSYVGGFAFTAFCSAGAMAASVVLGLSLQRKPYARSERCALGISALTLAAVFYVVTGAFGLHSSAGPEVQNAVPPGSALQADNPARPGEYEVRRFTYGSGQDIRRSAFGEEAALKTEPVDASAFVSRWNGLRSWYWGFDPSNLPVNGTVWLPEGDGPFPLVLMVHGNHLMEDFSDGGYGYLGELLASRGYAAVSVDENFVNYSIWSGIPDDDYALRAWLLLRHLQALEQMDGAAQGLLAGKLDLQSIALIGHSRGGQAAALAAVYDAYFRLTDQPDMLANLSYPIQTVIAFAPTDKKLAGRYVELEDINYLTLQGAYDSDVTTFDGDRQYDRVRMTDGPGGPYTKASLYLSRANHGQFNTTWGAHDIRLPTRLLMNTQALMDAQEQRQVAAVYISAFLELTMRGDARYEPMFRDWRYAAAWLPDSTAYKSRYMDSEMIRLSDYEEDRDLRTATLPTAELSGDGLARWSEEDKKNRQLGSRMNRAVRLEWSDAGGRYDLALPAAVAAGLEDSAQLAFSLAPGSVEAASQLAELTIRLTLADGRQASLSLGEVMQPSAPFYSRFLNAGPLTGQIKNGKLEPSSEQAYEDVFIPISRFAGGGAPVDPRQIRAISWVFEGLAPGSVSLDNVAMLPR